MLKDVNELIELVYENNSGEYELYFYKSAHKTFKIKQVTFPEGVLAGIRQDAISNLITKLEKTKSMVDYGTFEDEDSIKRLDLDDECIKIMYEKFISTLDKKEPVTEDNDPNKVEARDCDGYILIKKLEDDKRLFLFSKSKLVPKRAIELSSFDNETYDTVDNSKFVTLVDRIDFIIYDGYLYSKDYKFEKVFFVGDFLKEKVSITINEIELSGKLTPAAVVSIKNSKVKRQLLKYDKENFNLLTKEHLEILDNYADYDPEKPQLCFEDDYSAKVFIKLITGKIFFSDGKAYTGTKEELVKPIEEEKYED